MIKTLLKEDIFSIEKYLDKEILKIWNYELIKDEIDNKDSIVRGIFINNELLGFYILRIGLDVNELFLINIFSLYQNKGYASLLMNDLIDNNDKRCILEVNSLNTKAISLYEKYQFKVISIRRNYYKNNDALILERKI